MTIMPVKVLQIVDALTPGGTETMAVNLANMVSTWPGYESMLMVTRRSGLLAGRISPAVKVHWLQKRAWYDVVAFLRLLSILQKGKIQIVHAHSSSFYWPAMLQPFMKFKLVWHDHYGRVIGPGGKRDYRYKSFVPAFDHIFCASEKLLNSHMANLHVPARKIGLLPNFAVLPLVEKPMQDEMPTMVYVANFRRQKDHLMLIDALKLLSERHPLFKCLLVGGITDTGYYKEVMEAIITRGLGSKVEVTADAASAAPFLAPGRVGLISSSSEGLPLALLEYAGAQMPVVCTAVGQIPELVHEQTGWLTKPGAADDFAKAMEEAIVQPETAALRAEKLHDLVKQKYSADAAAQTLQKVYKKLLAKKKESRSISWR
jgi:glycosyltransferase involved in cell wall biosynthesis